MFVFIIDICLVFGNDAIDDFIPCWHSANWFITTIRSILLFYHGHAPPHRTKIAKIVTFIMIVILTKFEIVIVCKTCVVARPQSNYILLGYIASPYMIVFLVMLRFSWVEIEHNHLLKVCDLTWADLHESIL